MGNQGQELLSHHIIFGEIVVPGATYLEMVISAGERFLGGRGKKWAIEGVGFAFPLTFRLAAPDRPLKDLAIQLNVGPDSRWTLSSVDVEEGRKLHTHAEGAVAIGGDVSEPVRVDLEALKARMTESVTDMDKVYLPFANIGLPLQPRFRTVRALWRNEKEIVGRIEAEEDGTNEGMNFGPAVIDGSFQASMGFMKDVEGNGSLRIPLSCKRITVPSQGFSPKLWVHHELVEITDKELVVNSKLIRDDGVLMVEFEESRFREVRAEHIMKMLQTSLSDEDTSLLEIDWTPLEVASEAEPDGTWVFVGASEDLKKGLARMFPDAAFEASLEELALRPENKVVYVGALGASSLEGLDGAVLAVQKV